jgi:hypothetical protein
VIIATLRCGGRTPRANTTASAARPTIACCGSAGDLTPTVRKTGSSLSGQDVHLGQEPAWNESGQLALDPGLVVDEGDGSGQDHDEVVCQVSLTKQHLPVRRWPHLTVAAQQHQLLSIHRRRQSRIRPRILRRH